MGSPYSVSIRISRYSGISREQAGPKDQTHIVEADNIDGALCGAKLIVRGIRMNPAVWMAEILSVTALRDDHTVRETAIPEAYLALTRKGDVDVVSDDDVALLRRLRDRYVTAITEEHGVPPLAAEQFDAMLARMDVVVAGDRTRDAMPVGCNTSSPTPAMEPA